MRLFQTETTGTEKDIFIVERQRAKWHIIGTRDFAKDTQALDIYSEKQKSKEKRIRSTKQKDRLKPLDSQLKRYYQELQK